MFRWPDPETSGSPWRRSRPRSRDWTFHADMTSLGGLSLEIKTDIVPDVVPGSMMSGVPGGFVVVRITPARPPVAMNPRKTSVKRKRFIDGDSRLEGLLERPYVPRMARGCRILGAMPPGCLRRLPRHRGRWDSCDQDCACREVRFLPIPRRDWLGEVNMPSCSWAARIASTRLASSPALGDVDAAPPVVMTLTASAVEDKGRSPAAGVPIVPAAAC